MPGVSNEDLLGAINNHSKHVDATLDEHRREITDLYTRSEATDKAAAVLTTKFDGQVETCTREKEEAKVATRDAKNDTRDLRRPWYTAAVAAIVSGVTVGLGFLGKWIWSIVTGATS